MEVIKLHHYTIDTVLQLDIWDSRLLNCTLLRTDQGETFCKGKAFPVDLVEFGIMGGMGKSPKEVYDKALISAKKLRDTPLDIKLPDGSNLYTSLVYEIHYDDKLQTIALSWNPAFVPLISGDMAKGKFMFPRVSMAALSSNKRYGLYLLIEKGLYKASSPEGLVLRKEAIREVLGIDNGSYKEWKDVTRRFIKPTTETLYSILGVRLGIRTTKNTVTFKRYTNNDLRL